MHVFRILPSACAFSVCVILVSIYYGKNGDGNHGQYGTTRLEERSMLHAQKSIPKQIACRLTSQ